ncbi:unannotated protein [freshwater metagenome]|uniref:dihydroneopterin aldolase n=1 Tax=freshwater metagenome TaxID=449393 RepID=A0A6J7FIS6_9ZZZZ
MADLISLTGLRVRAHHGVYPQERERGQEFVIDIVMHCDTTAAARCDNLAHTIDYVRVTREVVAIAAGEPVNLIETLAERIARRVLAQDFVDKVDVTVHKPGADVGASVDDVCVTIHRERATSG